VVLEVHRVRRRRQHLEAPEAQPAVGGRRREAVRVGDADHVDAVDRVRVAGRRERRALGRGAAPAAYVPEHNLPRVGAANHQVRVERSEAGGDDLPCK